MTGCRLSDWLASLAGTPEGAFWATVIVLISALSHAVFGALQKGIHDPWLTRGVIDGWLVVLSLPLAIWLVPLPDGPTFLILAGAVVIHFGYKCTMALAYERAAYTVVYPVVRGTGPVIVVIAAALIFAEHFNLLQWMGVALVSGSILLLALRNLSEEQLDPLALRIGLAWALVGGLTVAAYTTYDAWGIRQSPDPMTFVVWFFLLSSIDFAVMGMVRFRRMDRRPAAAPLMVRGAIGALIAYVSFGGILVATYLDKVGEAAVLRETSTVFAALIGWFILGETVGPRRLVLMCGIALGAVIVELGG